MNTNNYTPAKEVAEVIGISYSLLMSRIYNGKIKFKKVGWAVYILNSEVKKLKAIEVKRRADASNEGVEGAAG